MANALCFFHGQFHKATIASLDFLKKDGVASLVQDEQLIGLEVKDIITTSLVNTLLIIVSHTDDGSEDGYDGSEEGYDGSEEGYDGSEDGYDGSEEGYDGSEEGYDKLTTK